MCANVSNLEEDVCNLGANVSKLHIIVDEDVSSLHVQILVI